VKWSALRRMYRYSSDDTTSETEVLISSALSSLGTTRAGVVESITGAEATVSLEDGTTVTVRST
jgi:hypothetical protein